jgi:hypothetical protein
MTLKRIFTPARELPFFRRKINTGQAKETLKESTLRRNDAYLIRLQIRRGGYIIGCLNRDAPL